jgi:hypothetical protein
MEESNSTLKESEDESIFNQNLQYLFGMMIVNTYLGYFDRVKHLAEKYSSLSNDFKQTISLRWVYFAFYYALALVVTKRRWRKKTAKLLPREFHQMLDIVADVSNLSEWNFKNKFTLLLAEKHSTTHLLLSKKSKTCSEYAEAGESLNLSTGAYHTVSTHYYHVVPEQKPNTIWQLSCQEHLNLYKKKVFHASLPVCTTKE